MRVCVTVVRVWGLRQRLAQCAPHTCPIVVCARRSPNMPRSLRAVDDLLPLLGTVGQAALARMRKLPDLEKLVAR